MRETPGWSRRLGWFVVLLTVLILGAGSAAAAEPTKFTLMTVLLDGTKIWLPSSLMVHQGEDVELTLIISWMSPMVLRSKIWGLKRWSSPKRR